MLSTRTLSRSFSQGMVPSLISAKEYGERRLKLGEMLKKYSPEKDILVLIKGAATSYIAPDVPHHFRQCSHFRYLTGVTVPNCSYLMHIPAKGPTRRILFMKHRTAYEKLWEGDLPPDSELENTAAFDDILAPSEISQFLAKFPSSSTFMFHENEKWEESQITSFPSAAPILKQFKFRRGINDAIYSLRLRKSDVEVNSMRNVCRMGSEMMASAISSSRGYVSEAALAGLLEFEAKKRGADMLAYPPVVAAGNRANTIHYLDANKEIGPNDCLLVDAGCDLNGYVSDITRCWPISGVWTKEQRILYEALLFVHEQLLAYANESPKVRLSDLFTRMIELLAGSLLEAGVIPKNLNEKEMLRMAEEICPHHVSHYLGMDVHDCPTSPRDIELPPNVVFTIEPGVYIPKDMTTVPTEYRGIGFRIEDDVVTTPNGIEVLTSGVCRSADEIEYLMNPM